MNYFGNNKFINRAISDIVKAKGPRGEFEYALFPYPSSNFGNIIPGDFAYNYYPKLPVKSYSFGNIIPGDFAYNYYPGVSFGKKQVKAKKTKKTKVITNKKVQKKRK
jgi:hypothetical protein